jgi:hypothetical protein
MTDNMFVGVVIGIAIALVIGGVIHSSYLSGIDDCLQQKYVKCVGHIK